MLLGEGSVESMPVLRRRRRDDGGEDGVLKKPEDVAWVGDDGERDGGWERKRKSCDSAEIWRINGQIIEEKGGRSERERRNLRTIGETRGRSEYFVKHLQISGNLR